ncbi:DUF2397 domain-containing protein [Actinoalloteichus spitiensis]|uniref:DUF2397 domain-containing protein n=1 Tax=Actinoalloteichus spitiensis TaxID=252394 RepID=UPI0009FB96C8|nr:DUF2397 domain-containing protein [Actinoalloteichus spitiensis]
MDQAVPPATPVDASPAAAPVGPRAAEVTASEEMPETAGARPADRRPPGGQAARLQLYAYLTARDYRRTYLAIMRLFSSTLLADLSAGEVAGALAPAERAGLIDEGEHRIDNVIVRLRQLVEWGNLVHGRREMVAASIAEFQHGGVRYQISKLALRVQREADALLQVPEGAREVSRELLPAIERGLDQLGSTLARTLLAETEDASSRAARQGREELAEQVTTLFLQHAELADTVRDFYAYLGQMVARHQLEPADISGFRSVLVEYIQMVVEDVLRYTPGIAEALAGLRQARSELLRLVGPARSWTEQWGETVERGRGRTEADWRELTDWFVDGPGRPSQVTALREATTRAIGALLANVKRATTGSSGLPGRRSDLLRLAAWFDGADQAGADTLYAAAFGLYPSRNLLPAPELDGDDEHTPWRDGPVIDVTVSVRSRGDRGARGRTSRVVFDPITEQTLLAQARSQAREQEDAVAELVAAAPRLTEVPLSPPALGVLCELLTLAMAQRERDGDPGSVRDPVRGLRLTVTPDAAARTTITSTSGSLTLHGTTVSLCAEPAVHGGSTGVEGDR